MAKTPGSPQLTVPVKPNQKVSPRRNTEITQISVYVMKDRSCCVDGLEGVMISEMSENKKRLMGGKIEVVLEFLLMDGIQKNGSTTNSQPLFETEQRLNMIRAFLLGYRRYIPPDQLFYMLCSLQAKTQTEEDLLFKGKLYLRIIQFIVCWLRYWFEDINQDLSVAISHFECRLQTMLKVINEELSDTKSTNSSPISKHLRESESNGTVTPKMNTPRRNSLKKSSEKYKYIKPTKEGSDKNGKTAKEGSDKNGFREKKSPSLSPLRLDFLNFQDIVLETQILTFSTSEIREQLILFLESNSSQEIAKELTQITKEKLQGLSWAEFRRKIGGIDKSKPTELEAVIERSNRVSKWVSSSILSEHDFTERAKWFKKFVAIASYLFEANDYESLSQVLFGLNNVNVTAARVPENVSSEALATLEKLNKYINPENNFGAYRRRVCKQHNFIPFFVVFLRDLTVMSEISPNYLNDSTDLINFEKLEDLFNLINTLMRNVSTYEAKQTSLLLPLSKNSKSSKTINQFLLDPPVFDEQQLSLLSAKKALKISLDKPHLSANSAKTARCFSQPTTPKTGSPVTSPRERKSISPIRIVTVNTESDSEQKKKLRAYATSATNFRSGSRLSAYAKRLERKETTPTPKGLISPIASAPN